MKKTYTQSLLLSLFVALASSFTTNAQETNKSRLPEFEKHQKLNKNSYLKNIPFRNVGPTVMSGRVTDLDVNPQNPNEFYVAYASSGLWHSITSGVDFSPIFDHEATMTIGDVVVNWNSDKKTIWVGTGENNSSRSSYAGLGVYKSEDNGKTWEHAGLENTQHIGRIVLHPKSENTLWVASIGNLYSKDENRGVYKSTDGGVTWDKTLFISDSTGVIDLIIDPKNPDILYASAWERTRKAWNFKASGKESGIYKSIDGGTTWKRITNEKSGFPSSEGVGRIGLAISSQNSDLLYAYLDNQDPKEKQKDKEKLPLTREQLKSISSEDFLAQADENIDRYLDHYNFPKAYTSKSIKKDIKKGKYKPIALVDYLGDAEDDLFNTEIKGAEVYQSKDGGKTWKKTHSNHLDRVVYTFGYYFGNIRVSPQDDQTLYILGVPVLKSTDGGKTWKDKGDPNVHVDHHALWINPKNQEHIVLGNDGGINISYDGGDTYFKANSIPVGQFYAVNVDMAEPYNIYGGLQDNGVWVGSSKSKIDRGWQNSGKYPFQEIMGGDGMQIGVDTRDNETVYTGYQFGNYYRINTKKGVEKYITPKHDLSEKPLRWNWQSPLQVSSHNEDIIYFGSNRFHRSMNKGEEFEALSDDLTNKGIKGNVPYGTLTTISESPIQFGLIYTGSDDGKIFVSEDVGASWKDISNGLPEGLWVSRVIASKYDLNTVIVSLNGYRNDDFNAYLYSSNDRGKTWKKLGTDLPLEPINVVKEDPNNEDILYIGTDNGLYASYDKGTSFMILGNLPNVAVHDLVVHPRENEIVVGTHGRAIYVGDLSISQTFKKSDFETPLKVFSINEVTENSKWGMIEGYFEWGEPIESKVQIPIYNKSEGTITINILLGDKILKTFSIDVEKGFNYIDYNLSIDTKNKKVFEKALNIELKETDNKINYLKPGQYTVSVSMGNNKVKGSLTVKEKEEPYKRVKKKKIP
ncbi:glycosyl hydrolase [Flammeovirga sp. SJP92]|uniref:WD40/YVTN/BNR-like repeat-containing protein n=1 Tax=Flammeovirga sp. SJP92 TaxID=1775430 RepID=UPI000786E5BD|nr:glycosyl hydrolase [Flammeovirga sp. SJP92]KXX68848.1 glycosyl hydrolase [Flammeovirga sp. SJP92]